MAFKRYSKKVLEKKFKGEYNNTIILYQNGNNLKFELVTERRLLNRAKIHISSENGNNLLREYQGINIKKFAEQYLGLLEEEKLKPVESRLTPQKFIEKLDDILLNNKDTLNGKRDKIVNGHNPAKFGKLF